MGTLSQARVRLRGLGHLDIMLYTCLCSPTVGQHQRKHDEVTSADMKEVCLKKFCDLIVLAGELAHLGESLESLGGGL